MYAFFIPPYIEQKDRELLASAIAKVAQNFRFEAQVFHEQPLKESVLKAYAVQATVFIPLGDNQWFDQILTQSVQSLTTGGKLPTFHHLVAPSSISGPVPALKEQYLHFRLRQKMSVLAARRLNKRFLYRAGGHYFIDTIQIRSQSDNPAHFSLELNLVNQGELQCDFEATELTLQAFHHADHDQVGLLYLSAQRPTLHGSKKIQSKQPLARFSSQITTKQSEPILRIPIKNVLVQSSSKIAIDGQDISLPLRIGPLAEKITVIEAKNTLQ